MFLLNKLGTKKTFFQPAFARVTSSSLVCLSLLSLILAAASRFRCLRRFLLYNSSGPNSSSGRDGFRPGRVGPFGLPSELTEFTDVTELTLFGSRFIRLAVRWANQKVR